jgi:hypothetical protein
MCTKRETSFLSESESSGPHRILHYAASAEQRIARGICRRIPIVDWHAYSTPILFLKVALLLPKDFEVAPIPSAERLGEDEIQATREPSQAAWIRYCYF